MASNELRAGREVERIVWPDDSYLGPKDDPKVNGIWMVDVPGQMGMVQWCKVIFEDGTVYLVNPNLLAMIQMRESS